jgi:hypothetical protein
MIDNAAAFLREHLLNIPDPAKFALAMVLLVVFPR